MRAMAEAWGGPLTFRQGINHKHDATRRNGKLHPSQSGMMPYRPDRFRPGIKLQLKSTMDRQAVAIMRRAIGAAWMIAPA